MSQLGFKVKYSIILTGLGRVDLRLCVCAYLRRQSFEKNYRVAVMCVDQDGN